MRCWRGRCRSIGVCIPRNIGRTATAAATSARAAVGRTATGWAVAGVRGGRHALLSFDEDVANIVGGDVDGIGDTCHTQDSL